MLNFQFKYILNKSNIFLNKRLISYQFYFISMEKQKITGKFEGVLPNAEMGKVVTRFPPEPSGYLHIGHIKAAMLNFHYAKMYQGQMILRFDDTNPAKENEEYVDNIKKDLARLEIIPDRITHTSDYFDYFQDQMTKLIEAGNAYCDNTPVEQVF